MNIVHVGKFVRRAALVASTAFFSACAPSSISAPPPMRPLAPEGPALAGRRIGMSNPNQVASVVLADAARAPITPARVAL